MPQLRPWRYLRRAVPAGQWRRALASVGIRVPVLALILATVAGALTIFRADALPPVVDLDSTSADLTVYGDDAGDASGRYVAAGDINGDTVDDLIIGAERAESSPGNPDGEVYVIYGGGSLPSTIDLNSTGADFTVRGGEGIVGTDLLGCSLAVGDIDGDTTDDLIMGACNATITGRSNLGITYVVYGDPSLSGTIDLSVASADLTVYGDDYADMSAIGVAAGDIDGDTTDDLIIGAFLADGSGSGTSCGLGVGDRCEAGETYVIYGGPSLPATIDLGSTSADLTIYGDDADDKSGCGVAAGDIDGDTIDDVIIGARDADGPAGSRNWAGEAYVIYGSGTLPSAIDLNSTSAGLTVYADDPADLLTNARAVAAGDIDGDTTDDLIIGAMAADGPGSGTSCGDGGVGDRCDAGQTYVIYGGPSLPAAIDLHSTSADLTVYGDDAGDWSGYAVAAGDIDGDTTDDLIITAPYADPPGGSRAGETYVIYGGPSLPATIDLDSESAGITVYGDDEKDQDGQANAAVGDIDGDTTADLIIGADNGDSSGSGTSCGVGEVGDRCEAGETYVLYGGPAATPTPTVTPIPVPSTSQVAGEYDNPGWDGDGQPATDAQLNDPHGLHETEDGALFLADTANHRIRVVNREGSSIVVAGVTIEAGEIETVAGDGSESYCGDSGAATSACLNDPRDVFVDEGGDIYIADTDNNRIRMVDGSTGTMTTVAGNGSADFCGDGGVATSACLDHPRGVAVDAVGGIYIADTENDRIRYVDPASGNISTVVGTGSRGYAGDGGSATAATLNRPHDVYPYGEMYAGTTDLVIADTGNNVIRWVHGPSGIINTLAGTGTAGFGGDDGPAVQAQLNAPEAVTADDSLSVYIADTQNDRIRGFTFGEATITTTAGGGSGCPVVPNSGCPATDALLDSPAGVAPGSLYGSDTGSSTVVEIDPVTGEPVGSFSGTIGGCYSGTVGTIDFLVVGITLGLIAVRERIRGLVMRIRSATGLVPRPART